MRNFAPVLQNWMREYGAWVTLAVVYIEEAHATDEWPISSARCAAPGKEGVPVCIARHTTLDARFEAATSFMTDFGLVGVTKSEPPLSVAVAAALTAAPKCTPFAECARGGGGDGSGCIASAAASAAALCHGAASMPFLVDALDNNFQDAFAAWPIRWFLLAERDASVVAAPLTEAGGGFTASSAAPPDVVAVRVGSPDEASLDPYEILMLLESIKKSAKYRLP